MSELYEGGMLSNACAPNISMVEWAEKYHNISDSHSKNHARSFLKSELAEKQALLAEVVAEEIGWAIYELSSTVLKLESALRLLER